MNLFKRFSASRPDTTGLPESAIAFKQKAEILLNASLSLLYFLKTFALDKKELHVELFRANLDHLSEHFKSYETSSRVESNFETQKENIAGFIKRQHAYIEDTQNELRDIIDLLTRAMANHTIENRDFYQRLYDQGEKIIELNRLDDIKKIKNALKHEIEQMNRIVERKRDLEQHQMKTLASQVDTLRQELEKTKAQSMIDGLTGAYNRQAFDDHLASKINHCEVMNQEFVILFLDLDNFKTINDNFGHLIGDRVLIAFTQKCRSNIRSDDFLARYGGEEFSIILSGASLRNGIKKASQICKAVSSARYTTGEGETGDHISLTVSIGVCAYRKGDTPAILISRADKALYNAKKNGKNQAVAA